MAEETRARRSPEAHSQPHSASLWHAHCFAPPMPPAELHLRAIERGVVSEGGLLAYGRERAGESALLSAGRRRALREKGGMTVSAQRASGGPTGYPPAGDQPCAARCGRALIGGAPARRCTRLPLCQPRQRAGGAQSRSEETAGSQGAATSWRCPRPAPSRCAARRPRSNAHLPGRGGHETG